MITMPKFDRLLMVTIGVMLVAVGLAFRSIFPQPSTTAQLQDPIEPETMTGEYDRSDIVGEFLGQPVVSVPVAEDESLAQAAGEDSILGVQDEVKRIEVDLTNQRLYTFEGDRKVHDFLISSGKWGRTPTGEFRIWGKFKYAKMSGGRGSTYYYLPNVPFIMYFSNDQIAASRGFGIHGTYWHDNFGHPMSHGCINMRTEEAEQVFYWAHPVTGETNYTRASEGNQGTRVIIYGEAPLE